MKFDEIKNMTIEELCNELERKDKLLKASAKKNTELKNDYDKLNQKVNSLSRDKTLKDLLEALRNNVDLRARLDMMKKELATKNLIIEELKQENAKLKKDNNNN